MSFLFLLLCRAEVEEAEMGSGLHLLVGVKFSSPRASWDGEVRMQESELSNDFLFLMEIAV